MRSANSKRKSKFEVVPVARLTPLLHSVVQIPKPQTRNRVLSIANNRSLALTRSLLFSQGGLQVSSAVAPADAIRCCSSDAFDLIVIGHSIPYKEKKALLAELRRRCTTPVLALYHTDERILEGADYTFDSSEDPPALLEKVKEILKQERRP